MKPESEKHVWGTSRESEEKHLKETLDVIHANMGKLGSQVQKMREDIDEMLEHFHDDNPELINLLENTTTLHDLMARELTRNEKAENKPYFGRIDFYDKALKRKESLYIGRGGIAKDSVTQTVIDWRAPIANPYYENGLGVCTYQSPDGTELEIDLQLKRTYEIERGKLHDFYDTEVISNDELLTKYLARNKQAVLGEIVATIQKEQNEIIRRSPYHNVIVQGVAGSGKTTVAMHRISYILYNYQERFRPEDFYIVGSNRILLNYITGVLPDLDVHGVRQMTMEQLFVRLLYEDWDEKKYQIKKEAQNSDKGKIKGTELWFQRLKEFCDTLEWNTISTESVYLTPKQFVEGLENGKSGVYDRSTGNETIADKILLVEGRAVSRYIRENPTVSLQSKINMLNERLKIKIKEEFLNRGVMYTEPERKAILSHYRNYYGGRTWKQSTYRIYETFLKEQITNGTDVEIPTDTFDVYDLAALAYIYKRTKETEVISEAHHIVIDEAQDFGMMAYQCLNFCIKDCTYTIMGDVSQNIHFGFGLNDWEGLKRLLLPDEMDSFGLLKKSYRNTVEISNFATNILHHGNFVHYPVEPIIRHGREVEVVEVEPVGAKPLASTISSDNGDIDTSAKGYWSKKLPALAKKAASVCRTWQEKGLATIAIVCRNQAEADQAAAELRKHIEIMENDLERAEFGNGIMVLPVEYTKGLEFDAVIIMNPTRETYPTDDGHAKLLYVAATRALHELCVLHTGNLTGLIADPIPEKKKELQMDAPMDTPAVLNTLSPRNSAMNHAKETKTSIDTNTAGKMNNAVPRKKISIVQAKTQGITKTQANIPVKTLTKEPINTPANTTAKESANAQTNTESAHNNAIPRKNCVTFGDMPPTEKLRPLGHQKIDLSIRWVTKESDGLYLQSRYGVLRLSPISSSIVRVTFAKGSKIMDGKHPGIAVDRIERFWRYRENSQAVEFTTDELVLRINKSTGSITFMNQIKTPLLSETAKECRQIEPFTGGKHQTWTFFESNKKEQLFAVSPAAANVSDNMHNSTAPQSVPALLPLKGVARYINPTGALPFLISSQGYGILFPSEHPVISCDLPAYGTYIHTEGEEQIDYYFIVGKNVDTLGKAYAYLTGEL